VIRQLTLGPDPWVERELAGGESHYYRIALEANQYMNLRTGSGGVDVVLTLFGPDGKKLAEVDTPVWGHDQNLRKRQRTK
jgi:hypothetical protein